MCSSAMRKLCVIPSSRAPAPTSGVFGEDELKEKKII